MRKGRNLQPEATLAVSAMGRLAVEEAQKRDKVGFATARKQLSCTLC
jgi:hypothetical protein